MANVNTKHKWLKGVKFSGTQVGLIDHRATQFKAVHVLCGVLCVACAKNALLNCKTQLHTATVYFP